jgi:DNA-binding SARP family transcriptional activator/GAF domain-containing protein
MLGEIALLTGSGVFTECIDQALDVLRIGAGADACELFVLDVASGELLMMSCASRDIGAFCSQERFDLGSDYPGIVAREARPLATCDLARDTRFLRTGVPELGYRSFACVPVVRGEHVLGTLHLAWKDAAAPVERGMRLSQAAVPPIATGLLASFADLASRDGWATERKLKTLARRFRRAGSADIATIGLSTPSGDAMVARASTAGRDLWCEHLSTGCLADCPGTLADGRCEVHRGRHSDWPLPCQVLPREFGRIVGVPLFAGGAIQGAVFLGYRRDPPVPSTRHMPALLALARDVAPLIGRSPPRGSSYPSRDARPRGSADDRRLQLRCLGEFEVLVDGARVPRETFSRAKSAELLKVLALQRGRPLSRDALVERLWPGVDLASGAQRFHVAMHALRRAVEPPVQGRRWVHVCSREEGFALDLATCTLDLEEFRRLLGLSLRAELQERPVGEVISLLAEAIGLYRGDLFDGDPLAQRYAPEVAAYRDQYLEALIRLSRFASRQGAVERAISLLRRATEVDPLREDVHELLVRALWKAGRKLDARRQYDRCATLLMTEFGIEPAAGMQRLGELLDDSLAAVWRS